MFPAPGLPASGPGFLPARGALGHVRDTAIGKVFMRMLTTGADRARGAAARADQPGVRFPRALPDNARYVGPQLDDPAWAQEWDSPWPKGHVLPLVVVAFSSPFQNQAPVLQKIIDALGQLRVRGLVTLEPSLASTPLYLPPNVAVREAASQARAFADAAAVIADADHGTVIRALAHGVPLLCRLGVTSTTTPCE